MTSAEHHLDFLRLTLPSGAQLDDAGVLLGAWDAMAPVSTAELFDAFRAVPALGNLTRPEAGANPLTPVLVRGSHPALNHRGHVLKRHKVWLQDDFDGGFLKYGYTGWTHMVAGATRSVDAVPAARVALDWLNSAFPGMLQALGMPLCDAKFNHVIFTEYLDHKDYIGMHADKERDFVEGSYFVVVKLGAARKFRFEAGKAVVDERVLEAGGIVIVRTGEGSANRQVTHGVPAMKEACGPSGSLVFRCIATKVPWAKQEKESARSWDKSKQVAAAAAKTEAEAEEAT